MLDTILKKFNPFKQKGTHVLFCIPRSEGGGAAGPLPQFLALPIDDCGALYYSNYEHELGELSQKEIFSLFNKKIPTLKFSGLPNTVQQFKELFDRTLEKDHREFSPNELADFGFGNIGFCMGNTRLAGGTSNLFFDLV